MNATSLVGALLARKPRAFLFGGIHMNLLNGFDSYMIYKLLANLFHTSIEQVYWSLTVGGLIVVVIIFAIYYLVGRGFK